ncbi:MAG: VTT domain-containing protein [Candidatus Yonathbacteria bacterium]|nr:VTT domain-containing protein [Candidatus Yonathbacteria bacterium]
MEGTIALLLTYKYLILIPIAIVEGPIASVIAGFLVTLGFLNIFWVYVIIVLGDIVGDTALYYLGYGGKTILHKYGAFLGITPERLEQAKRYFEKKHQKAIILSKIIHGVGIAGLVTAGILRIPYRRYIKSCITVTIPQSAILLLAGVLFGHAYLQIGKYLDYFAATISVVVLTMVAFLIYKYGKFPMLKNNGVTRE